MKIKYFEDTDTAQMEFSNQAVVETREINENLYIDLDAQGNLVNMTIEHASASSQYARARLPTYSSRGLSLRWN